MGRYVGPPPGSASLAEEYRAARLRRMIAMRLAVPATEDAAAVAQCHAALGRGSRSSVVGQADALAVAAVDVLGDLAVQRLRAMAAGEQLPSRERQEDYVRAVGS